MKQIDYSIKNDSIIIYTNGNDYRISTEVIDFDNGDEGLEIKLLFEPTSVHTTNKLVEQLKSKTKQKQNMREFLQNLDKNDEPWHMDRP